MGGDDGYEKPVKSCLALHEMDLKPYYRFSGILLMLPFINLKGNLD